MAGWVGKKTGMDTLRKEGETEKRKREQGKRLYVRVNETYRDSVSKVI